MWKAFAEYLKECGRHSGAFFLVGLLGAPACAVLVSLLGAWAGPALWSSWAILFGAGLVRFVHQWRHPARLGRLPPLSRHDLRIARAKLARHPSSHHIAINRAHTRTA